MLTLGGLLYSQGEWESRESNREQRCGVQGGGEGREGGEAAVGMYCMKKYNKLFFNV